jgi:uncharacterized membrane protein YraQ (UPF0718 family)
MTGVGSPSVTPVAEAQSQAAPPGPGRHRIGLIIWLNLAIFFLWQGSIHRLLPYPELSSWGTVFMATMLQALPFLVLGVGISAAIAAFVPGAFIARAVPRRARYAVPMAGLAGAVLPGCECSAAPVARRLVARGVPPAAALTFLLAAPAINPIVLVSTAVAFPGHPEMVAARFLASFATAVIVGLIWARKAAPHWMRDPEPEHDHGNRVDAFVSTVTTDFVQAGGFLVIGAALVATLQTLVPQTFLDRLGGSGLAAVLTMAVLAVVLSVCSEADAFIAAGLTQFSLTSRLVFLVVGPMVDLKLVALQVAIFGRQFAARFAPLTFAVAVVAGSVVGWFLL